MEEDARRSIHPVSSYISLEGKPCIRGVCLWSPSSYLSRRVLESLGQGSLYYGPSPLSHLSSQTNFDERIHATNFVLNSEIQLSAL